MGGIGPLELGGNNKGASTREAANSGGPCYAARMGRKGRVAVVVVVGGLLAVWIAAISHGMGFWKPF
jgi:hypothetical protein